MDLNIQCLSEKVRLQNNVYHKLNFVKQSHPNGENLPLISQENQFQVDHWPKCED